MAQLPTSIQINKMSRTPTHKEYCVEFFTRDKDDADFVQCNLCTMRYKCPTGQGWTNAFNHLKSGAHPEYAELYNRRIADKNISSISGAFGASEKAKSIHFWIRKIVFLNLPFSHVEESLAREGHKYKPISVESLKKYMHLLKAEVVSRIKKQLIKAKTFGIAHDGWTHGSDHYLGLFALFTEEVNDQFIVREPLLSCAVQADIDEDTVFDEAIEDSDKYCGFAAEDIFDMIMDTLVNVYDLKAPDPGTGELNQPLTAYTFKNLVEFQASDNCSTNRRLCNLSLTPMSGCNSHRLHLAVGTFIGPEAHIHHGHRVEAGMYRSLVNKVDSLMGELTTLKNASLLRSKTLDLGDPKPQRKNKTRWSSIFSMLLKWQTLRDPINEVEGFPATVTEKIPSDEEHERIVTLIEYLKVFESVSKALQCGGTDRKSLADARALFDGLCAHFDTIDDPDIDTSLQHLRKGAGIVNNPHFENGIVKIQIGNEQSLTAAEKSAVKMFLIPGVEATDIEESHADRFLRTAAHQRRRLNSKYRSTRHVPSQVNICERLFSGGRLVLNHLRSHMNPDSLELVLFLKINKDYWLDAKIIDDLIVKERQKVAAAAASLAQAQVSAAAAAAAAAVAAAADDDDY
jgi:hypothetical protein